MILKTPLAFFALVAVLAGCTPKDQAAAQAQSNAAIKTVGNAMADAWRSATAEAKKLDEHSAKTAIEDARAKLEKLKDESRFGDDQVQALKEEIQRLDALDRLKQLQSKAEAAKRKLERIKNGADEDGQNLKRAQVAWESAQERIMEARDTIKSATRKVDEAFNH